MNSVENQFKIELFKRFLPRYCDFINNNNTYNFVLKFDNDVLNINNINVKIDYFVGELEARLAAETDVLLGTFEMQHCHIADPPFLSGLNEFIDDIINNLIKRSLLDNIGNMPVYKLSYNMSIKDFVSK